MKLEVHSPIFVVGTGRSGSTVFFDVFTRHPNVAWLSRLSEKFPGHPWLNNILMQCRSHAVVDFLLGKRLGPSEAYPFWDLNCPGFSNPCRDLRADDVTPLAASRLREATARSLTSERNRFLAKITGWPRVRYLHEIFTEALFIEVTRDPCATISSLLEVPFWDGWRGPSSWRRGPLPHELEALWRQEAESFVALAAIEFVIVQKAMLQCRATLRADQIHTVSYSSLCADPIGVFRDVIEFCRLSWSARFEKSIRHIRLSNRDDKWQKSLTVSQQGALLRTLERAQLLQN